MGGVRVVLAGGCCLCCVLLCGGVVVSLARAVNINIKTVFLLSGLDNNILLLQYIAI
jgi:hypothetical protein